MDNKAESKIFCTFGESKPFRRRRVRFTYLAALANIFNFLPRLLIKLITTRSLRNVFGRPDGWLNKIAVYPPNFILGVVDEWDVCRFQLCTKK